MPPPSQGKSYLYYNLHLQVLAQQAFGEQWIFQFSVFYIIYIEATRTLWILLFCISILQFLQSLKQKPHRHNGFLIYKGAITLQSNQSDSGKKKANIIKLLMIIMMILAIAVAMIILVIVMTVKVSITEYLTTICRTCSKHVIRIITPSLPNNSNKILLSYLFCRWGN